MDATVPCNFNQWSAGPIIEGHPSICRRGMDLSAVVSTPIVRNKPYRLLPVSDQSVFDAEQSPTPGDAL